MTFERIRVSIPFKREGTWKGLENIWQVIRIWFPFPSNGKAHGKNRVLDWMQNAGETVSIPFKREGTWKVKSLIVLMRCLNWQVSIPFKREGTWKDDLIQDLSDQQLDLSFNSLQTGRHMERIISNI